ncbi:PAS domain-containing protein [Hyphomicrobium sp.]|uniref:PAS domain-containing protein n=1 Tax=Hyphomicrobium sp. TaxID=82 RepID=UPI002FE3C3DC
MSRAVSPTRREVFFEPDEIIVSKTDPKGRLVYVNDVFMRISGYTERELLGKPHSIIRHPDMPRALFKALWDTLLAGQEIFAYVKNMSKNGDHYWVLAHVTPSFDANGTVIGCHSNRRVPQRNAIEAIEPLYAELVATEAKYRNAKEGLTASFRQFVEAVKTKNMSYAEFVLSL